MDPSFLIGLSSALQQRQMAQSTANRLATIEEEKRMEADRLAWKRNIIESLTNESDKLIRDINIRPIQIAVLACAHLGRMDRFGIVPEAFKELKEQEEVTLLWRKFHNIRDQSLGMLSQAEQQIVQQGICASIKMDLIRDANRVLEPYNNHFLFTNDLQRAEKKNRNLRRALYAAVVVPTTLLTLASMVLQSIGNPNTSRFILFSVAAEIIFVSVVYYFVNRSLIRNLPELKAAIRETYRMGAVDNTPFWDLIRSEFGGIPTFEQMDECWREQEVVWDSIFPPEPEADQPGTAPVDSAPAD